jgi:hypothetical protein
MGFIMHQDLHWISLASQILTKRETTLITGPHIDTLSVWVQGLFVGRERNNILFLYLQLSSST